MQLTPNYYFKNINLLTYIFEHFDKKVINFILGATQVLTHFLGASIFSFTLSRLLSSVLTKFQKFLGD